MNHTVDDQVSTGEVGHELSAFISVAVNQRDADARAGGERVAHAGPDNGRFDAPMRRTQAVRDCQRTRRVGPQQVADRVDDIRPLGCHRRPDLRRFAPTLKRGLLLPR